MTQLEIRRREIAEKTAEFLAKGGQIEVLESENIPNYREAGNFKGTTEVYV